MISKFVKIFLFVAVGAIYGTAAFGQSHDVVSQKKELEQIKKEIEGTQKNLDSLRGVEKGVLKEISDYEQKANMNKTVLDRLNNQLSGLRKDINNSKGQLQNSEDSYKSTKDHYIENLTYYYSATQEPNISLKKDLTVEKDYLLKRIYLKALSVYDRDNLFNTEQSLQKAQSEYSELLDEKSRVDKAASQKKREYTVISSQKASREKDLSRVRQKKETEADRLVTLSEAAKQMEELISASSTSMFSSPGTTKMYSTPSFSRHWTMSTAAFMVASRCNDFENISGSKRLSCSCCDVASYPCCGDMGDRQGQV